MLRSATHCTSGGDESSVTSGGAILRMSCLDSSSRPTPRMWIITTYHGRLLSTWFSPCVGTRTGGKSKKRDERTLTCTKNTLPFTCWNCGTTRLADVLAFLSVLRLVACKGAEDRDATPFRALVQRR